ncbi:MAG: anti-sigma factor [Gemmatimonadetes bacterium]|nr:MAG: anti-sigma factor [Gemmatimonadota bacterium]
MTHPVLEEQLDAYLDGELAAVDARELEAHLAQCADCARFRDGRVALRAAIETRVPALRAPGALRDRVRAALRATAEPRASRPTWRALALAASLAAVALGSWRLALWRAAGDTLTDEVLTSHVRSLMPGHLTDVLSSDQHTVKPWFNGRLDFSPPVYDFAGRGYPLLGGRLDYLNGRTVAVLVYGRRQHVINVFLWPAARGATAGPAAATRQGYHLRHWTATGYAYWVVSDLGVPELTDFTGLLARADTAAAQSK